MCIILFASTPLLCESITHPEKVAEAYFNALKNSNYEEAAKLYRISDIEEFKSLYMFIFQAEKASGSSEFLKAGFGQDATLKYINELNPYKFDGTLLGFIIVRVLILILCRTV